MTTTSRPAERTISTRVPQLRTLVALVLAMTALVGLPQPAAAHGRLKRSVPAADARLDTIPTHIRLEFSERVELRFSRVVLSRDTGDSVALSAISFGDTTKAALVMSIPVALVPGRYIIRWQTAGTDGHPVRGQFAFSISRSAVRAAPPQSAAFPPTSASAKAPGSASDVRPPTDPGVDAPALFDERSMLYVAVRWLQFVAVFLVVGAFVFSRFVLVRVSGATDDRAPLLAAARTRTRSIGVGAAATLVLLQLSRLVAQRTALQGGGDFRMEVSIAELLIGTAWGTGLLLAAFGSAAAAAGFWRARQQGREPFPLIGTGIVAVAIGFGLSGHQAASTFSPSVAVGIDALHVLATAGWLGTVAVLSLTALPLALASASTDHSWVAKVLQAFSPVMLVTAGIAGVTGVLLAALNLGALPALWQSGYGRVLLVKLGLLSMVTATGAYNWRRVLPTAGTPTSTRLLRRSASAEALIAVAAIVVSAVLVATPLPTMP